MLFRIPELRNFLPKKGHVIIGLSSVIGCYTLYKIYHSRSGIIFRSLTMNRLNQSYIATRICFDSWIINIFSSHIKPDYRRVFRSLEIPVHHSTLRHHSHGDAATWRCYANNFMNAFTQAIGHRLYSVSMSATENGRMAGDHKIYVAKDLASENAQSQIYSDSLLRMTDVDYYVDMPSYLDGHNIILYTFVPDAVASCLQDYTYCFNNNNELVMTINGGARYQHKLWNYDLDHVIVRHWWGAAVYLVEQRKVTDTNKLVYFNVVRLVYGPLAWFISGQQLTRLLVNHGKFNIMKIQRRTDNTTNVYYSIGYTDALVSIKVPESVMQTVAIRTRHSKSPQISDVERIVRASELSDPCHTASVLYEYLINEDIISEIPLTVSCYDNGYQSLSPIITEDGKPTVRTIMVPLLNGAFYPDRSYNNDTACLNGRVISVANKTRTYAPFYWQCLNEFLELLIPEDLVHTINPSDYDEQYAQFHRPTQRGFIERFKNTFFYGSTFVSSFQKAEAYGKVTHPRNISTLPMDHNFRLGQYIHPIVSLIVKKYDWYAFGKHPQVISQRIYDMCIDVNVVTVDDISKIDGSGGYLMTVLDQAIVMRAVPTQYHTEILNLLVKESVVKGYTMNGIDYLAVDNTLSGSSRTSFKNTTNNAFAHYCALRKIYSNTKEAWEHLGLYGGDDGFTPGDICKLLNSTYANLGYLCKSETRDIHSLQGVPFLGRLYLDPWIGKESVIDVKRHLSKLHVTVSPIIVPTNVVVHRKVTGFEVTDPETPIISEWCATMRRIYPAPSAIEQDKYASYLKDDVPYWSRFESPYPQLLRFNRANEVIAANLDVPVSEVIRCVETLKKVNSIKEYDKLMIEFFKNTLKVELPVAIKGEIILAPEKPHQEVINAAKDNKIIPSIKRPSTNNYHIIPPTKRTLAVQTCRYYAAHKKCPHRRCKFAHAIVSNDKLRPLTSEIGKKISM